MIRLVALLAGSSLAGCAGFAAALYATFPSSAAARYGEYQFHAQNRDYALSIGDVRPWLLPGARATDVTVYTAKKGRKTKDEPSPPIERTPLMTFDSLSVRLRVIPRLLGKWSFSYDAGMLGGSITGTFTDGEAGTELDFEAEDLDLAGITVNKDDVVVNLGGILSGQSDLAIDLEDVKNSTGSLSLSFDGLSLGEGSTLSGITLPVVAFTKSVVKFEAKEGKLEVTEGTFDGDVLDMVLSGDIALNKKLAKSRNRLELVVTLPADLDKLAQVAPQLKKARDPDGGYHFAIGGTLVAPTFRPSRTGSKPGRLDEDSPLGRTGLSPRVEGEAASDADPEDAREERRKRREERIKERRERLRKRREESTGTRTDAADAGDYAEGGDEGGYDGEEMPGPRRRPGMGGPNIGGQGDFPDQGFEPPPEPPDGGWNGDGGDMMPPGEGGPNFEE